jgi:hypothetical protein
MILDQMIGGEHQQDGVVAVSVERGQGADCRRRAVLRALGSRMNRCRYEVPPAAYSSRVTKK